MPDTTTVDQEKIAGQDNENRVDMDKMLNDKNFFETLTRQKDLDAENLDLTEENEELREKYDAFQESKQVSKELIKLCGVQIFKESEIKAARKELRGIEKYLGEQVFEDPERIKELKEQMKEFKELPERIANQEKELAEAKEKLEELESNRKKTEEEKHKISREYYKGKEKKGKINKLWRYLAGKEKKYLKEFSDMDNFLSSEIKNIEEKKSAADDTKKLKDKFEEDFSDIKYSLFMEIEPIKEIFEKARQEAKNKIKELGDPKKDLASSEKALKYLSKMQSSAEEKESSGYDFLEGFEFKEGEDNEEYLDEQIKGKITSELMSRIQKTKIGSKPLDNFEKKLSDLIYKKEIGTMGEEESKQWIIDELDALRTNQTFYSNIDNAKIILLRRIIVKLEVSLNT